MPIHTEEERDAQRQTEIHAEIQRIANLEAKQTEVGVSGAASRGELWPKKKALLDESELILQRQIKRLGNA